MSFALSPTDQQILRASSIITTYGGMIMFALGAIGNTINILAFSCLKVYRSLPTSAFLAAASFFGQLNLSFSLFFSALSNIIGYNPAARDARVCKTYLFMQRVTVQITLTCLCMSAIDRYLMTSRSARLRALVTPMRARLAIGFAIVIWSGYGVPGAIYTINYPFYNLCIPTSNFSTIITYLNLVLAVLIPIGILSVFGLLTWKNLHRSRLSAVNLQVSDLKARTRLVHSHRRIE